MSAGGTKKLTAKVTPKKNVYKKVAWTSSNKKVATVTSKGVVKGLSEGTAKITASAVDGSKKKECFCSEKKCDSCYSDWEKSIIRS